MVNRSDCRMMISKQRILRMILFYLFVSQQNRKMDMRTFYNVGWKSRRIDDLNEMQNVSMRLLLGCWAGSMHVVGGD